jgi:DNA-binding transcriptional LysR family regulator
VQQGLGAAVLSTAICAEGLTDGRLIALLDGWTSRPMDVYAIYPSSRTLPVAARRFLDLLIRDIPSMARGIAVSEGK